MSSEIERARARRRANPMGLQVTAIERADPMPDALAPLLEMNHALSTSPRLEDALRGALEVLVCHPRIARAAATLSLSDTTEVIVEGVGEAPRAISDQATHGFVCTTIMIAARPIGALAVDLAHDSGVERGHAESLLYAAAEVIAQSVAIRQLLGSVDAAETPIGSDPHGAGAAEGLMGTDGAPEEPLADMVARYEKGLIENALRATRGNRAKAAKLLQTTERIVGYRVHQYGIDCRAFRD